MKKTLEVINELKWQGLIKDYAIGGAIAVLRWTEPFFTRDLDIFFIPLLEPKNKELILLSSIHNYLNTKGYNKWIGQWIIIEGVPVEFLPAEGLAKEAVENAMETEFESVNIKVMISEYLIALLLKAGRDKDKMKIEMLLNQTKINMDKLENILSKYNLTEKLKDFKK